jgi:hypothetical protein
MAMTMKSTVFRDVTQCGPPEVCHHSSKTKVNFYETVQQYIPEEGILHYNLSHDVRLKQTIFNGQKWVILNPPVLSAGGVCSIVVG